MTADQKSVRLEPLQVRGQTPWEVVVAPNGAVAVHGRKQHDARLPGPEDVSGARHAGGYTATGALIAGSGS